MPVAFLSQKRSHELGVGLVPKASLRDWNRQRWLCTISRDRAKSSHTFPIYVFVETKKGRGGGSLKSSKKFWTCQNPSSMNCKINISELQLARHSGFVLVIQYHTQRYFQSRETKEKLNENINDRLIIFPRFHWSLATAIFTRIPCKYVLTNRSEYFACSANQVQKQANLWVFRTWTTSV